MRLSAVQIKMCLILTEIAGLAALLFCSNCVKFKKLQHNSDIQTKRCLAGKLIQLVSHVGGENCQCRWTCKNKKNSKYEF